MTKENKLHNIARQWERAARALSAAESLLRDGLYEDAVARAYYHALQCARALLLSLGLESKTHSGVSHFVALHFVRAGKLDPEVASYLTHLETDRVEADYDAAVVFTAAMAEARVAKARSYGEAVRTILQGDGYLP